MDGLRTCKDHTRCTIMNGITGIDMSVHYYRRLSEGRLVEMYS